MLIGQRDAMAIHEIKKWFVSGIGCYNNIYILHHTVRYGTVRHVTVRYSTVPYRTVVYGTVPYDTAPHHMTVSYGTVLNDRNRYGTVQYRTQITYGSALWYGMSVPYCTVPYGTVPYRTTHNIVHIDDIHIFRSGFKNR